MGRPPKVKPQDTQPDEKLVMIPETAGMGIGSDRDVVSVNTTPPVNTDPAWTAYFLSHLQENEKVKSDRGEAPTVDGLRRVFELLVGVILISRGKVVEAPNNQNMQRATVEFELTYRPHGWNENRIVGDGADICHLNAKPPYINYPIATAMTTAESRCLKKAAKLVKVLTADEMIEAEPEIQAMSESLIHNASSANPNQINVIKVLMQRNNIDPAKCFALFKQSGIIRNETIETLMFSEAQQVLTELTKYNSGPDKKGLVIPESILKD